METRLAKDGIRYTESEFRSYFDGLDEWHAAAPTSSNRSGPAAGTRSATAAEATLKHKPKKNQPRKDDARCTVSIESSRAAHGGDHPANNEEMAAAVNGLAQQLDGVCLGSAVGRQLSDAATSAKSATPPPLPLASARTGDAAAAVRITVGNLSGGKKGSGVAPAGFSDVRIDRQTAMGNPFPMGADGHDEKFRDAVCEACNDLIEDPLRADVDAIASKHGLRVDSRFKRKGGHAAADPQAELASALDALEARLRKGESLRLLCWCVPKRCHGDGIASLLQRRVGKDAVIIVDHASAAAATGAGGAGGAGGSAGGGAGGGGSGGGGTPRSTAQLSARRADTEAASGRGGRGRGRGRGGRSGGRSGVSRLQ